MLWGSLANSFLRNLTPQPRSVIQIATSNVLARVTRLMCVIGATWLGRLVQRLLAALKRSPAGLRTCLRRQQHSMKWTTDDDPHRDA